MKNLIKLFFLLFGLSNQIAFSQMTTFGSTTGTCDCYQLTAAVNSQAGSIWSPNSIDLTNSFDLTFSVNLGTKNTNGADGMVFVIRQTPGAPGISGQGMGYGGITNSIGIEIDTYNNPGNGDIPADHIGMHVGGSATHGLVAPIGLPNVEDGLFHTFRVTWNPITFEIELFFDGTSMFTHYNDLTTTVFAGNPLVYFGWTASTGGANNNQTVCSYRTVDFISDHEDITGNISACPNELISFTDLSTSNLVYNSTDITEWFWDFGDGTTSTLENPTHYFAAIGTYNVTLLVKDITGCFSEITRVVEIAGLNLSLTASNPSCSGFNDGSITVNVLSPVTYPAYIITNTNGDVLNTGNNNYATGLGTGWYYATVNDTSGGCSGWDSVYVLIGAPLTIDAGLDVSICSGETVTLSSSGAGIGGTYLWDGGITDGVPFAPNTSGLYTVTGTDANGCQGTDDVNVIVNPLPNVLFEADIRQGCPPLTVNFSTLEPGSTFEWSLGDGSIATGSNVTHIYTETGFFDVTLTITSVHGCVNTDTYNGYINIVPNPVASFLYTINDNEMAGHEVSFLSTSIHATSLEWNFGDGSGLYLGEEIEHDFPEGEAGEYEVWLIASNDEGCIDSTVQIVSVMDKLIYFVPNAFTPDGDEFNNIFQPVFASGLDIYDYHLQIFNQWGELLFESLDTEYGWDGNYGNGGLVKDGVYVWQINFGETMSDKQYTERGTVTMLK